MCQIAANTAADGAPQARPWPDGPRAPGLCGCQIPMPVTARCTLRLSPSICRPPSLPSARELRTSSARQSGMPPMPRAEWRWARRRPRLRRWQLRARWPGRRCSAVRCAMPPLATSGRWHCTWRGLRTARHWSGGLPRRSAAAGWAHMQVWVCGWMGEARGKGLPKLSSSALCLCNLRHALPTCHPQTHYPSLASAPTLPPTHADVATAAVEAAGWQGPRRQAPPPPALTAASATGGNSAPLGGPTVGGGGMGGGAGGRGGRGGGGGGGRSGRGAPQQQQQQQQGGRGRGRGPPPPTAGEPAPAHPRTLTSHAEMLRQARGSESAPLDIDGWVPPTVPALAQQVQQPPAEQQQQQQDQQPAAGQQQQEEEEGGGGGLLGRLLSYSDDDADGSSSGTSSQEGVGGAARGHGGDGGGAAGEAPHQQEQQQPAPAAGDSDSEDGGSSSDGEGGEAAPVQFFTF